MLLRMAALHMVSFIDLPKALDIINHDILLCQLNHYKIRGVGSKAILVKEDLKKKRSEIKTIKYGVPPCFTFGRLLFLKHINNF